MRHQTLTMHTELDALKKIVKNIKREEEIMPRKEQLKQTLKEIVTVATSSLTLTQTKEDLIALQELLKKFLLFMMNRMATKQKRLN